MPTAFLTGATGFVGGHVARALAAEGWRVRALTRRAASRDGTPLTQLPVEPVSGDLSGSSDLEQAIRGSDAIVHVAGLIKARRLQDYRDVNVAGTQRLLSAAAKAAPSARFVLVSSQAAAGPAQRGRPVAEGDSAHPVSWYGLSKREGEEAVSGRWEGEWVILRPGVIYGPGDQGVLTFFQMAARGWMLVPAASSRVQIVAAEEVALAVARAAARPGLSGRIGFLANPEPISIARLVDAIASLPRRRPNVIAVPSAIVRLAGLVETLRESIAGRSRPFNADKARELLAGDWICDPEPMRRDLSLPAPEAFEHGLRRTWDWYVARGWIRG